MIARAALEDWIERQQSLSTAGLLRAISATHMVKERRAFGQSIRPTKGSVLASPVIASYDPDPDYFFHWTRDSAVVMDALRHLIEGGTVGPEALRHFEDFVAFSLSLLDLDGAACLRALGDFRSRVEPFYLQYVREDSDLHAVAGEHVQGEPRFNPDGTLDILKWSRPQHDGPALRALTVLRFWPLVETLAPEGAGAARKLLDADLGFTLRHWMEPSFDPWEEELGAHYYTRLVQQAALAEGARWHEASGDHARAMREGEAADSILSTLSDYWSGPKGFIRSRLSVTDGIGEKELDMAVVLAVVHAGRREGPQSILDPEVQATLLRLEELFAVLYPINRACGTDRAPAMGRYRGDAYYSGGAYYFSTFGAAEFCFRLAEAVACGAAIPVTPENDRFLRDLVRPEPGEARLDSVLASDEGPSLLCDALLRRGEAFLSTVAAFAPASGELAEQFDQTTGAPASAKDLAWSHAAFITAAASRKAALGARSSLPRRSTY